VWIRIISNCRSHVKTKNYINRLTIRKTWGEQTDDVQVVFLLGQQKTPDPKVTSVIEKEWNKYHDVIEAEGVIDAYRNLTLKSIAMLQWVDNACKYAKYIQNRR